MSILKVIDSVLKKLLGKLHYILNDPRICFLELHVSEEFPGDSKTSSNQPSMFESLKFLCIWITCKGK